MPIRSTSAESSREADAPSSPPGLLARAAPAAVACLLVAIALAVAVLSRRSVWVDEAMFLRNVFEFGPAAFVGPLPYYDQAAPFLASVLFEAVERLGGRDVPAMRMVVFAVVAACAWILLVEMRRGRGTGTVAAWLVGCVASTYSVLLFATELKHYALELGAGALLVAWFTAYLEDPPRASRPAFTALVALAMLLSFASIVAAAGIAVAVTIDALRQRDPSVLRQAALPLAVAGVLGAVMALHLRDATVFQLANYREVYASGGAAVLAPGGRGVLQTLRDLAELATATAGAPLLAATALATLAALSSPGDRLLSGLGTLAVVTVALVVAGRLTDAYPVFAPRHIVWMLPIALTVVACSIAALFARRSTAARLAGSAILALVLVQAGTELARVMRGDDASRTDNEALYRSLASQPPSDVLVYFLAEPSLAVYATIMPGLDRHRYFGRLSPSSGFTPDEERVMRDFASVHDQPGAFSVYSVFNRRDDATPLVLWQFEQLPDRSRFLLLLSHTARLEEEPAIHRIRALRTVLQEHDCVTSTLYAGRRAQLLSVSCRR